MEWRKNHSDARPSGAPPLSGIRRGRLRLSGCNRPGVIFQPVPKHPPGFAFMIKRGRSLFGFGMGLPCFPGYWNNAKMQRGPQDFRRHFSPAILFFPAPGGTFCPKDDEPISFCIIFSDAGRTIPVRIFLTCARRTDLLLSGAAGIGRIPVPAGRTPRPAPFLLLAGFFL